MSSRTVLHAPALSGRAGGGRPAPATRTRRSWVLANAAGVAAFGTASTACGGGPAASQPAAGWAGPPVTLQLWDREEPSFQQYMTAWVPAFEAKQPRIKVVYSPRPPQWQEKLTAALAAGTPPDVIAVFRDWFRTYQQQGLVLPLDQYMRAARFDGDDFLAPVYRALNWAGKQVGVPQYYSTRCVYYNRDLFQQAGVPLPAESWTHEQLVDAARRLTRGPAERQVWGLTSSGAWSNPLVTIPLVWARCGDLNDPKDPNVFTFSRPENVAAFQWVHDLRWKERLAAGTNEERGGVNGFDAIFTTGSAAMHVGTTAGLGAWKDRAQTNWDIVALPSGPCGRGEQASVDGYAIPAGTKTPDASWVAVHGLTDRDSNKLMAQTTGLCPGRKSQFGAWVDTIPGRSLRRALPTEATRPSPDALWPKAADVSQVVNTQLAKYFDENSVSLQSMLQQLAAGVSGVLGPGAVR